MEFTKTTGMMWAKSAGCNQIRAIFATGRAPRVYKSTEFEVNGVHISFTVYAKTQTKDSQSRQYLDSCQHHVLLTEMP